MLNRVPQFHQSLLSGLCLMLFIASGAKTWEWSGATNLLVGTSSLALNLLWLRPAANRDLRSDSSDLRFYCSFVLLLPCQILLGKTPFSISLPPPHCPPFILPYRVREACLAFHVF